jgi:UDP-N-acetylmuramyl pentapeptide phosphotransferase/UDP-N-acetylglucosamine-1-phosphate transferase
VKVFIWQYIALGLTSFVVVGALTPYARRFAMTHQIYDMPDSSHKSHAEPIPYLGGLAIIVGTIVVAYAALFAKEFSAKNLALETSVLGPALLLGVFIDRYKHCGCSHWKQMARWPYYLGVDCWH